jgi:PncC family amidohydrolase
MAGPDRAGRRGHLDPPDFGRSHGEIRCAPPSPIYSLVTYNSGGGLVVGALTAIGGSSDVVERGFVTYSNEAMSELLGVPLETIATHGAVSAETAAAMAQGALARAPVDLAVSVTGIAGPGGATPTKPVGLVLFGLARRDGECRTERRVSSSPATAPQCGKPRWKWPCSYSVRRRSARSPHS